MSVGEGGRATIAAWTPFASMPTNYFRYAYEFAVPDLFPIAVSFLLFVLYSASTSLQ